MSWTPIVGQGFTTAEFHEYVKAQRLYDSPWKPEFIVLHNTANPTIEEWHKYPGKTRMLGLQNYYRDDKKWSAGPHLFVADNLIWVFTPLQHPGVHSPSWNRVAWGVEMIGDYSVEPANAGLGLRVKLNTIFALATLCQFGNLDTSGIRLHKEDPKTTHNCPGKNISKTEMIARAHDLKVTMLAQDHRIQ